MWNPELTKLQLDVSIAGVLLMKGVRKCRREVCRLIKPLKTFWLCSAQENASMSHTLAKRPFLGSTIKNWLIKSNWKELHSKLDFRKTDPENPETTHYRHHGKWLTSRNTNKQIGWTKLRLYWKKHALLHLAWKGHCITMTITCQLWSMVGGNMIWSWFCQHLVSVQSLKGRCSRYPPPPQWVLEECTGKNIISCLLMFSWALAACFGYENHWFWWHDIMT